MPSTFLSPEHIPAPARGLARSHRELRQAQAALRVAASSQSCPPEGHAFWSLLRDSAARLEDSLARHLAHEKLPMPVDPITQLALAEQHTALVIVAVGLSQQIARTQPGDEKAWPALRTAANRVIDALERHLQEEEHLLPGNGGLAYLRGRRQSPSIA